MEDNKILYVDVVSTLLKNDQQLNNHFYNNHYDTVIFGKLFFLYDFEIIELPLFCKQVIIKDTPSDNNKVLKKFINKLKMPFGCQMIITSQVLYGFYDDSFAINILFIEHFIKDTLNIEKYELYELDKEFELKYLIKT
jgi:hypothetical protein